MTALRKSVLKTEDLQDKRSIELVNNVIERILKHVGVKCPHCIELMQYIAEHNCDKCGKESDELVHVEQYKGGNESQLCRRCAMQ